MTEVDITGALFCIAVQHHWEENGEEAPTRGSAGVWKLRWRCDNCGSDKFEHVDVYGVIHHRTYDYSLEFREAKAVIHLVEGPYTNKQQVRAHYLQFRRKRRNASKARQHLRRVQ